MTRAAEQILVEFEALPAQERAAIVVELARRVALAPHEAPSDEDLISAADPSFRDLDRRKRT